MCTSVSVISEDGTHVMGRTMDWYDLYVKPMYVPRDISGNQHLIIKIYKQIRYSWWRFSR